MGRQKRSKKACWRGLSEWVVKNVQRQLEWVVDNVQEERLGRGGFVGTNVSLETGRREQLLGRDERWVVRNNQRRLERVVGTGPRRQLFEEVWNRPLMSDVQREKLGRHVRNGYG